jgi:Nucleotidyl transferase AbiEii toxin, Type IV TA system
MESKEYRWHREVLGVQVEGVFQELHLRSALRSLYLAGGTGLALHLGHRRSQDLDFFSQQPVDPDKIVGKIQALAGFSLVAKGAETLHATVQGVKVSFLGYAYPMLFPFESFLEVNVADPRDIACMKISAIAGRGTRRDFVDLYVASQLYGLPQLLAWFKQKFAAANYSLVHVLKSLTYFEEAEKDPMPDVTEPLSWAEVKQFFSSEAPRLL